MEVFASRVPIVLRMSASINFRYLLIWVEVPEFLDWRAILHILDSDIAVLRNRWSVVISA